MIYITFDKEKLKDKINLIPRDYFKFKPEWMESQLSKDIVKDTTKTE